MRHNNSASSVDGTLIQTSIVRDELITALSLDLPEQGRFKAVRYAIGSIAGPDYSVRTGAILAAAKELKETQDEEVTAFKLSWDEHLRH